MRDEIPVQVDNESIQGTNACGGCDGVDALPCRLKLIIRAHSLFALAALERIRRRLLLLPAHRLVCGVLADLRVVAASLVAAQFLRGQV